MSERSNKRVKVEQDKEEQNFSLQQTEELSVFQGTQMESNSNTVEYSSMFQKGVQQASLFVFSQPEKIDGLLRYIWNKLIGNTEKDPHLFNDHTEENLDRWLDWVLWTAVSGSIGQISEIVPPEEYLNFLKKSIPSTSVCGYSWKKNEMVVSCKDCEMDPTCVQCMPCFLASNHKGHDYRIHKSGGGMCDCGDPQAWKRSGFCTKHSGVKEDLDPNELLPIQLVKSIQMSLRVVLEKIAAVSNSFAEIDELISIETEPVVNDLEIKLSVIIQRLLQFLFQIQSYGDAFRNIVARELGKPLQEPSLEETITCLDVLLRTHSLFSKELRILFHDFYLQMIPDYAFKFVFARHLIKYYGILFLSEVIEKEFRKDSGEILSLGVQLFTVPSIALELVKKEDLLGVLLSKFLNNISSATKKQLHEFDFDNAIFKDSQYWQPYSDVLHVLTNLGVSQYVLYHNTDLFSKILRTIYITQGMNQHVRKVDVHILHELPCSDPVNLEANLLKLIDKLLHGFELGDKIIVGAEAFQSATKLASVDSLLAGKFFEIFARIRSSLENWFEESKETFFPNNFITISDCRIMKYDVSSQPVSAHLILHRMLASFLCSATALNLNLSSLLNIKSMDTSSETFLQLLLEEPLRLQVWMSQIDCKMWVRNGASMYALQRLYKSSSFWCHRGFEMDLFLIQACSILLPSNYFFLTLIERYGLTNYLKLSPVTTLAQTDNSVIEMAESLMSLLITILCDRSNCSKITKTMQIRRYLVHRLATRDHAHSSLQDSVPKSIANNDQFDQILSEVSIYRSAKLGSSLQGTYSLKSECWIEFEGRNFLHYTHEELQDALQRYSEAKKKNQIPSDSFPKPYSLIQSSVQLFDSFADLLTLVNNSNLHSIIFIILFNAKENSKLITESLISQTLVLLLYCVNMSSLHANLEQAANPSSFNGVTFQYHNMIHNIGHKVAEAGNESILSLLLHLQQQKEFEEHKPIIQRVINSLTAKSTQYTDQVNVAQAAQESDVDDERDAREKQLAAQRRKEALLKQFAAQQQAFLKSVKVEEETEEFHLELPTAECALCRDMNKQTPIAIISYIQQSRVVDVVNRLNTCKNEEDKVKEITYEKEIRIRNELAYNKLLHDTQYTEVELHRNLEHDQTNGNIHLSTCGHFIHLECFQSYFASLLKVGFVP